MLIKASKKTYQRRLNQLIKEVSNHTNQTELLLIMQQQIADDTAHPYTYGHNSLMDETTRENG